MRSETVTTVVDADRETVFSYLSNIENLPKWATEFARRTAYTFTMFQAPGMADELFDSQYESLRREFANIDATFAAVRIRESERHKMLAVRMCGPRVVARLESMGVGAYPTSPDATPTSSSPRSTSRPADLCGIRRSQRKR